MKTIIAVLLAVAIFYIGRYLYFKPAVSDGDKFEIPDLTLINGETIGTADLLGQYVLVDFWGSWCGPCRRESPDLVELYNHYKDVPLKDAKGFKVLSIGIERNEDRWRRAIINDNLLWSWHYSSLQNFDGPLAKQFGIREIPAKFLLDPKGNIVLTKPNFAQIRAYLDDQRIN